MRKYVFLALAVSFLGGCAVTIATIDQEKSLESTMDFPGLSKSELYSKSLNWVARIFNSANDVIQLKDQEAGTIICKGNIFIPVLISGFPVHFTLIIDVKDDKIRTRWQNINTTDSNNDINMYWENIKKRLSESRKDLYSSIKNQKK
jgi:hypothetical protein